MEDARQDHLFEHIKGGAVAEEVGHPDQHLLHQGVRLLRVLAQQALVGGQVRHGAHLHAALDAAQHGRLFVMVKILPGVRIQQRQHLLQALPGRLVGHEPWQPGRSIAEQAALADGLHDVAHFQEPGRNIGGWQHEVHHARIDRRLGHAAFLGVARELRDRHAAMLLDAGQAGHTVRTHAGEHHADRPLAVRFCQGTQEDVDRHRHAQRTRRLLRDQVAVLHPQAAPGRDDVDLVRPEGHAVGHLPHRHGGGALQHPVGRTGGVRGQVQHDHQRHPGRRRQVFQQSDQRRQAAGGGANPDDRERRAVCCRRLGQIRLLRFVHSAGSLFRVSDGIEV